MRAFVTLYSKAFLEADDDSWSARPNNTLLQRLHNGEGSARWVACISESYVSIGDPVSDGGGQTTRKILYLPQWFMESLGVDDGCEMDIEFKRSEEITKATSLTFRMIGQGAPGIDIRDLLEEPLSQLGVLQVGQIIPVPALEGNMLVLESCEPDGVVFLDGAEIALDILNDENYSPIDESFHTVEPYIPSPSIAAPPPEFFDETQMLPMPPEAKVQGAKSRFPPKYTPFQGVGNTLGGV